MNHDQAGRGDLRTIANGLFPSGQDVSNLTAEGRDEVRAAVDALLRMWDRTSAKLELALRQLDKAADEIKRLQAENAALRIKAAGCNNS